jgi:hypothetical protein
MKVTCVSNSHLRVSLEPETAIEQAFIATILERAANGQPVKIETAEGGMAMVMEA